MLPIFKSFLALEQLLAYILKELITIRKLLEGSKQ